MAERLLTVPRTTKAGVTEALAILLVRDCALSDLDELWLDLPLVGTRIVVDHSSSAAVREYKLVYGSASTVPSNAVAITGHTGYYWVPAGNTTRNVIVVTSAAARTLTVGESGSRIITTGNAGTAVVNLPAAVVGLTYEFQLSTAFALQIEPATGETIGLPSTGVQEAANDYITADAVNEYVTLVCDVAGTWTPSNYLGTWTGQ